MVVGGIWEHNIGNFWRLNGSSLLLRVGHVAAHGHGEYRRVSRLWCVHGLGQDSMTTNSGSYTVASANPFPCQRLSPSKSLNLTIIKMIHGICG